jgi:hypothetical protein
MSPEEIRKVFAESIDRKEEVEWAIERALAELHWLSDHEAKAASPYSLSRLTAGLAHAEAIIAMALRLKGEWDRRRLSGGGGGGGFESGSRFLERPGTVHHEEPLTTGLGGGGLGGSLRLSKDTLHAPIRPDFI